MPEPRDATPPEQSSGPPARSGALERFVEGYLATLGAASPSTQRQRTWALRELLAHSTGLSSPAAMLTPDHVRSWLDVAATADPPASLPGLRARASAARALAQHGERSAGLGAGTVDALGPVLRMPAPPLAPGPDPDPVRRLLVAAHPDRRPLAVHPAVWTRFCAHVHLLALTGEREDVMAQLALVDVTGGVTGGGPPPPDSVISTVGGHIGETPAGGDTSPETASLAGDISHAMRKNSHTALAPGSHIDGDSVTPPLFAAAEEPDQLTDQAVRWEQVKDAAREQQGDRSLPAAAVAGTHLAITGGLNPRSWPMSEPARTAVNGWLRDRAVLSALLQGAEPAALWLRVRPSTDLRTGALRPAGLPVSDRGLRLAFTTTVAVLALEDPDLADLSTAAVRAYARGRGPA